MAKQNLEIHGSAGGTLETMTEHGETAIVCTPAHDRMCVVVTNTSEVRRFLRNTLARMEKEAAKIGA